MKQDLSQKYEMILFEGNPFSTDTLASRLLRRVPGRNFALHQLKQVEQRLLSEFKYRLEKAEPRNVVRNVAEHPSAQILHTHLHTLLEESQDQSHPEAEFSMFMAVLKSLVPDEARIFAALSEGASYPLIHVEAGTLFNWTGLVVECVSSVGKNAGVQCCELTHLYVQHLLALGLVEIDHVENNQTLKYELLETEAIVRIALERLKKSGQRSKILRRTLRMSSFGERLWKACKLHDDQ